MYEVNMETGALRLVWLAASSGLWLKSFAVSSDGTLMAVVIQYSRPERLVLSARGPENRINFGRGKLAVGGRRRLARRVEAAVPFGTNETSLLH